MASKFKKFNDNLTPAELDKEFGKRLERKDRSFAPGQHEVKIAAVEDLGPRTDDATWLNYQFVFEGVEGRSTRTWLAIPTDSRLSPILDGQYPMSAFKKFVRFCEALGFEGTYQNPETTLATYFENPAKLVGLHLKIQVGFKGAHIDTVKDEAGKAVFKLVDKQNNPITDDVFPTREAVEGYVAQNNLSKRFRPFPEILSFISSETKNNIAHLSVKKPTAKVTIPGFE